MVAVYLDEKSVDKLHEHYPGTILGRMRKVVIQYGPSDKERDLYAPHFGGLATVKVIFTTTTSIAVHPVPFARKLEPRIGCLATMLSSDLSS